MLSAAQAADYAATKAAKSEQMIARLVDLRARLERQSFILGKNQNAIGSLHNVKNGLSPVNTLLSLIPQQPSFAGKADLARVLSELTSPETEAVRRQQLAAFASATVDSRVGQIVGNVLTNAVEAIVASGREDGGLGLHWCANTLGAMGGVLSLHSDGKGKGATIRVAIPAASQAAPDISQAA